MKKPKAKVPVNVSMFTKATDECLRKIEECDHLERITSITAAGRRIKAIWIISNDTIVGRVTESIVNKLCEANQLDHWGPEYTHTNSTGHDVWYPMKCDYCDRFYPLDESNYCEEHADECELCGERKSSDKFATEHVCQECANYHTPTTGDEDEE
jgi:hypothetical protein